MANDSHDVPATLLKLEQLRIPSELYLSARRALNDTRRALRDQRNRMEQQIQIEIERFSGRRATIGQGRPTASRSLDLHRETGSLSLGATCQP